MAALGSDELPQTFCSRPAVCEHCGVKLGWMGIHGFGWSYNGHSTKCTFRREIETEQRSDGSFRSRSGQGAGGYPDLRRGASGSRQQPSRPVLNRHATNAVLPAHEGESLRWLNALFAKMWPKIDEAAQKIVREEVTPKIKESLPAMLASRFRFKKFTLGTTPPTLGPISCYDVHGGLKLEVGITFESSVDIDIEVGMVTVGVRSLVFKGTLIVRFAPLIGEVPVVGGLTVYFLDPPLLEMDLTGLGNVAEMPGLAGITHSAFNAAVAGSLLLPNVIAIPLGTEEQGVDPALLSLPTPRGVLRATALQGENFIAADVNIFSKGTSDPYVLIELAGDSWRSSTVPKDLNPKWKADDWHEFVVFDRDQKIKLEVFDEDYVSADDLIGKARPMLISDALDEQETWIPLYDESIDLRKPGNKVAVAKNGRLLMRFEWLDIVSDLDLGSADGCLAVVSIKQLKVPKELGEEFSITVKVGGKERSSPLVKAMPPDAQAAAAVDKTLSHVVQLSGERGLDTPTIAAITGLSTEDVDKILSRNYTSFSPPQVNVSRGATVVTIQKVVYVPFHTSALETGNLDITVHNKKKVAVASGSLTLSEVRSSPDQTWSSKAKWPLKLAGVGDKGLAVEATVTVSLQALKQETAISSFIR